MGQTVVGGDLTDASGSEMRRLRLTRRRLPWCCGCQRACEDR